MELYDYQRQAINDVDSEFVFGSNTVILDAKVSFGKSITACQMAIEATGKVFISLSISSLITQFIETFNQMGYKDFSVIKAGMDDMFNPNAKIQIAFDNTLYARYLRKDSYKNLKCDFLIVDEYHIRANGNRLTKIIEHYEPENIMGMSGTPYGSRGESLNAEIIKTISHKELIDKGFLSQVKTYSSNLYLLNNFSHEQTVGGSEFSEEELSVMYNPFSIDRMISDYFKVCEEEKLDAYGIKAIWFVTNIDASEKLSEALCKQNIVSVAYHSKTKNSDGIMESFRTSTPISIDNGLFEGTYTNPCVKHIVSVSKLSTGFSDSTVDIAIMTSATKSRSTSVQRFGRMSRMNCNLKSLAEKYPKELK